LEEGVAPNFIGGERKGAISLRVWHKKKWGVFGVGQLKVFEEKIHLV